mmetsp:Transcript_17060/g.55576  ORF Transcript_17060/g.55576 Transcript_17060/m.55576 type:complete len:206 (-) Transcript_17060:355-972(-)
MPLQHPCLGTARRAAASPVRGRFCIRPCLCPSAGRSLRATPGSSTDPSGSSSAVPPASTSPPPAAFGSWLGTWKAPTCPTRRLCRPRCSTRRWRRPPTRRRARRACSTTTCGTSTGPTGMGTRRIIGNLSAFSTPLARCSYLRTTRRGCLRLRRSLRARWTWNGGRASTFWKSGTGGWTTRSSAKQPPRWIRGQPRGKSPWQAPR